VRCELVVLVLAAGDRRALREVARDDLPRRPVELRDAPLGRDAHQDAAREPEADRQREPVERGAAEHRVDLRELAHVAPDEEPQARTDPQRACAHRRLHAGFVEPNEIDPVVDRLELPRPVRHVAGEPATDRVREEIDRALLAVAADPLADHVDEADQPAAVRLLDEPVDLRLDHGVRLPAEIADRRPVDEQEQRADRYAEERDVHQRELEHARAKGFRYAHRIDPADESGLSVGGGNGCQRRGRAVSAAKSRGWTAAPTGGAEVGAAVSRGWTAAPTGGGEVGAAVSRD